MAKYSSIECYEEHATITEGANRDEGMTATVILRTPWSKRYNLMENLLSNQAYPFPHTPTGWSTIWPLGVSCVPDETKYTTDTDGQIIEYQDALVTVNYGTFSVAYDPGSDAKTMVNETLEPSVEYLKRDHKDFAWSDVDDPFNAEDYEVLKEKEAPGFPVRTVALVRQHYYVQYVHGSVLTLPGSVNSEPYTSKILGLTFPAGTLMFLGANMQRTFTNATATTIPPKGWTVTVRFNYRPQPWNYFYRDKTQRWEKMYTLSDPFDGPVELTRFLPHTPADFSAWLY